jgi:F5/8 type C domain
MLRKAILAPAGQKPAGAARVLDVSSLARVLVSSEERDHPVDLAFDGQSGPGATRWIAAEAGEQTLIVAFDRPQTLRAIRLEMEEPHVARTQELQVAVSTDGGESYREIVRQEYTFSPPGTSLEHERWSIETGDVTHLRVVIRPDKGGVACRATVTTLALE